MYNVLNTLSELLPILFCLFLKSLKAFSVSLIQRYEIRKKGKNKNYARPDNQNIE